MSDHLHTLSPPYSELGPARPSAALGSIIVALVSKDVTALADAGCLQLLSPWCPICVIHRPGPPVDRRIISAFEPFSGAIAQVAATLQGNRLDLTRVSLAVAQRSKPLPRDLAAYVVERTGRPALSGLLTECFAIGMCRAPEERLKRRSTFSRYLAAFGPLTARDWVAVASLVRVNASCGLKYSPTPERLAFDHEMDPRTLRKRIGRCLDCSFRQLSSHRGWEWILQGVLRSNGYKTAGASQMTNATERMPSAKRCFA